MNRARLREKLHLSGIDSAAASLARRYGLGFEITAFCMASALEDSAAASAADAETADLDRLWLHAPFACLLYTSFGGSFLRSAFCRKALYREKITKGTTKHEKKQTTAFASAGADHGVLPGGKRGGSRLGG